MFLLDTNVVSELMRDEPDRRVVAWMDRRPPREVATASVCVFELENGLHLMESVRHRASLDSALRVVLRFDLQGGILSLGRRGAEAASVSRAIAKSEGRSIETEDLLIAGTAKEHGATLVTRNTKHFEDAGVELINPWEA